MDASIGAALCPDNGVDAEALLQRADVAMYQAKEARTGFQAYDAVARPPLARAPAADGASCGARSSATS